MEMEHSFTIPVPVEQAWDILRDLNRIGPCIPGGTIDAFDGEAFSGSVKVKVGAIQITYQGKGEFVDVDEEGHEATIRASGRESRGAGNANAEVKATLTGRGDETEVLMHTELAVTGKPAQFGRGTLVEVGGKLVDRFAECLAEELSSGAEAQPEAASAAESEASLLAESAAADEPAAAEPSGAEASGAATATAPNPAPQPAAAAVAGAATPSTAPSTPASPEGETAPAEHPPVSRPSRPSDEPIDLLEVAGPTVMRQAAPALAAALLILLFWLARRRSR